MTTQYAVLPARQPGQAGYLKFFYSHHGCAEARRVVPYRHQKDASLDGSHMELISHLPTLLAVAVGALMSFVGTSVVERARWRRASSIRWDEARLRAYIDFVNTAKVIALTAARILAKDNVATVATPLDRPEGLVILEQAELERSVKYEGVLLLGDTATIHKAQELNNQLWRIQAVARDGVISGNEWRTILGDYRDARAEFYGAARNSMRLPSAHIPLRSWPTPAFRPPLPPSAAD